MRDVIVHYHVYKNAGSSLDALLQAWFGAGAWANVEGDVPRHTLAPDALAAQVLARPELRVVSSHQARLPLPEAAGLRFHPLLFLRHPIDRVGSVHAYERALPVDSLNIGARIAREGLADYVRWRLELGNGAVIRNFQVVHLSGIGGDMRHAVAVESDLARALEQLRALPFFGLVEAFDASVDGLRAWLQPWFGVLPGAPPRRVNASGRGDVLAARLDALAAGLGPELYARLCAENALDLALYEAAQALFAERTAAVA